MTTWFGGPGNDVHDALPDETTLYGGAGNDDLLGTTSADLISGDDGNDTLYGWSGNDTIYGGTGDDLLYGNNENDLLVGEAGNDTLVGGNNNDTLYGGAGNDLIYGDGGDALGQDVLAGGAGSDTLYGGAYNDTYLFTFNADGQDYISDSSGEYDTLNIGGVTNISGLEFHRATYYSSSNDSNDLVVQRVGDSAVSEFVYIDNYWSGTAPGAGRVEYLYVGGTTYWFNSVTQNL
ncbi:calcium-binding protein [Azospirillum sp. TSH64]|uniref:calcium-binding protein n=1 Tax=Azospirillum sp. TSH64 TaxID=652740 RepID=UPI0018EE84D5|nr:calcium-binding protein [Azospirillum sp. TSH64]